MTVEFTDHSTVELINFTGSDEMVARAAWVSNIGDESRTKEELEGIPKLIDFLYKNSHMSPFEHGQYTFYIRTPIFVAREFHRHRTQSYNEVSGRYSEMKPRFYIPRLDRPMRQTGKVGAYTFEADEILAVKVIDELMKGSEEQWDRYMRLKNMGVANEVARCALTINLITEFYATVNPRNLMQFLTLRDAPQALFEIREVAQMMDEIFAQTMPMTHSAFSTYDPR